MTPAHRRKSPSRQWLVQAVDVLEARALLTASVVPRHLVIPAHFEVAKKAVHAEKVAAPTVQVAKTSHVVAAKVSAKKATLTQGQVVQQERAIFKSLSDLTKSPLMTKNAQASTGPPAGTLTPLQVETAYTVTSLGANNQGQGQTIAIVDEGDDSKINVDANAFSSQFNLPQFNVTGGPTLTVAKDTTLGAVPSAAGTGVAVETSLDVEWAHVMAPKANILLVEVPFGNSQFSAFAALLHGIQFAASSPLKVSVVSLSYGTTEILNPPQDGRGQGLDLPALFPLNTTYLSTTPVTNVAVTVSTGDSSLPSYPATSPNVIGVGGTALHLTASGQYSYETAWGGSTTNGAGGGGPSAFFSTPTFQSGNGVNIGGKRSLPDVSMLADPATGVALYDSFDAASNGGNPWFAEGGTSLASPLFAGTIALAQQDRATAGKAYLTSAQINAADYALYNSSSYSTYFHDVTLGQNTYTAFGIPGYATKTGYDQATGIGSAIGGKLVPYLASL